MEPIPLTLSILRLSPTTLLSTSTPPPQVEDVPLAPAPHPSLPSSFAFSPTHNYPAPFGSMTLGTSLGVRVQLVANAPPSPRPGSNAGDIGDAGIGADDEELAVPGVRGVKMMLEVQGPGGRWRLGEVVHGEPAEGEVKQPEKDEVETVVDDKKKVPILPPGEFVEMDVQAEMKELGLQVLICSVAWETPAGRRTFQRFFKFNVVAPLSIKTKIHPSQTPMTQLDPERRSDVYLEVLMQNTSSESILFDKVNLEPVFGMTAKSITPDTLTSSIPLSSPIPPEAETDDTSQPDSLGSLHPGDTRQYLFLLHPQPPYTKSRQSVFPPVFAPGTILPLGRLDMAWLSGSHRERGRLQTSTLNRRVTAPVPVAPKLVPTRTSAAPPTPGQRVGTPNRERREREEYVEEAEGGLEWEYDLAVMQLDRSGLEVEKEFTAKLRVGVRSTRAHVPAEGLGTYDAAPPPVRIGIQYLSPIVEPSPAPGNAMSHRSDLAGPSRPMTPVSSQLRSATQTHLNSPTDPISISTPSFPPPPILLRPAPPPKSQTPPRKDGEIFPLGPSLYLPAPKPFELAQEQYSTTYADSAEPPERWEAVHEVEMKFLALEEGMAKLGGVRVLVLSDEKGLEGEVGAEWETLGEVWVSR